MADILVDGNVILDVVTEDPKWYDWSAGQLEKLAESHTLVINPIIYSEVLGRLASIQSQESR